MFDTATYKASSMFLRAEWYFDFITVNTENPASCNMQYKMVKVWLETFQKLLEILSCFHAKIHLMIFLGHSSQQLKAIFFIFNFFVIWGEGETGSM